MLPEEKEIARWGRRSIVAHVRIPKGARIRRAMLTLKRPGTGIEPKHMSKILGKVAKEDIERDTVIRWEKVRCQ
jgi:sialic acid synthase SpsE